MNSLHDKKQVAKPVTIDKPLSGGIELWQLPPFDAMRAYLELGYVPIVLAPHSKTPPKGFPLADYTSGKRSVTPATIDQWEQDYPPNSNVGLCCGPQHGLMVVEYDTPAAKEIVDSWNFGNTPRVQSAKGEHVYLQCPPDVSKRYTGDNGLAMGIGPVAIRGLDLLAGGYVVAPPSMHPDGVPYREVATLDQPLAAPPVTLLAMIALKEKPAPAAQERPPATATGSAAPADYRDLAERIAQRLGITAYNAAGWSNSVPCPFHDDRKASAVWHTSGQLYCHQGCKPSNNAVSAGKSTFGILDTAKQLVIPLPDVFPDNPPRSQNKDKSTPALRLGHGDKPHAQGKTNTEQQQESGIFPGIFPPKLYLYTCRKKTGKNKKGRPQQHYQLADIGDTSHLPHAVLTAKELSSVKAYRAAVYASFEAGYYKRQRLADRVGVSDRTSRDYDKAAHVVVTPNVKRQAVSLEQAGEFPRSRYDAPKNLWLESTAGRKYSPTKNGLRRAIAASVEHDGRAIAYQCQQTTNHYAPPARDNEPKGLPVPMRQQLLKDGKQALARVLDALLLDDFEAGDVFTAKEAIEAVKRYGIGKSTVNSALQEAGEAPPAPENTPQEQVPRPATNDGHSAPQGATEADQLAEYIAQELGGVISQNTPETTQNVTQELTPMPDNNSAPSAPQGDASGLVYCSNPHCGQAWNKALGPPPETCDFCGELTMFRETPPRARPLQRQRQSEVRT